MESNFKSIPPEQIRDNVFKLINSDWMLITAGTPEKHNAMTASWGGLGVLWDRKIAICFIRPVRYTYELMEKNNNFTLSFFEEKYRKALNFCGSKSGRSFLSAEGVNKAFAAGLTPVKSERNSVYFSEARFVLDCEKIYFQDIDPSHFLLPEINDIYPARDYHRMYVGEIISCLTK